MNRRRSPKVACLVLITAAVAAHLIPMTLAKKWTPPVCFEVEANSIYLCDGKPDCADGSDESPSLCTRNFNCSATGRVVCPNSPLPLQCVDPAQMCDGRANCPNAADEDPKMCKKINCTETFRQACPKFKGKSYGYCLGESEFCDGYPNCPKETDEDPATCAKAKCSATGRLTCPKGVGCLGDDTLFCNGAKDCKDGSDEEAKFCNRTRKCSGAKCPKSNQCLQSEAYLCNGVKDCLDGSDEDPKYCAKFDCGNVEKMRCPGPSRRTNNACIRSKFLCDGIPRCPNATDEDPKFCSTYQCGEDRVKCPGTGLCVIGTLCDGIADCPISVWDKGVPPDENPKFCSSYKCPYGGVKCGNNVECIDPSAQCDGRVTCSDGSDESAKLCTKSFDCKKTGRISCPGGKGGCMNSLCSICDGIKDCADGSDEDKKYCKLKKNAGC